MAHEEVVVDAVPNCDMHKLRNEFVEAVVDGKTKHGPWAFMCQECFDALGLGLGLGLGQRLVLKVSAK